MLLFTPFSFVQETTTVAFDVSMNPLVLMIKPNFDSMFFGYMRKYLIISHLMLDVTVGNRADKIFKSAAEKQDSEQVVEDESYPHTIVRLVFWPLLGYISLCEDKYEGKNDNVSENIKMTKKQLLIKKKSSK
uniref:CSON005198 protein n=1 Tax=Culicoides sonorensis TaxID=179676 RepID=A0A336MV36_CULSO